MPDDQGLGFIESSQARRRARLGRALDSAGQVLGVQPGERQLLLSRQLDVEEAERPLNEAEHERYRGAIQSVHRLGGFGAGANLPDVEGRLLKSASKEGLDLLLAAEKELMDQQLKREGVAASRAARAGKAEDITEVIRAEEEHQRKNLESFAPIDPKTKKPLPVTPMLLTVNTAKSLANSRPRQFPSTGKALEHFRKSFELGGNPVVFAEAKKMRAVSNLSASRDPLLDNLLNAVIAAEAQGQDTRTWWERVAPEIVGGAPAPSPARLPKF